MALIKCPDCSTEVSDQAAACPKCARPMKSPQQSEAPKRQRGNGVKILGALMCIGAIPACTVAMASESQMGVGVGVGMFVLGFILFIAGRLKD